MRAAGRAVPETHHDDTPSAQDTFYVGTLRGVGRIYQQTFIDTSSKVGFAKLYSQKTPITAADLLNALVVPFFEEHGVILSRISTDRGTEYCPADTSVVGWEFGSFFRNKAHLGHVAVAATNSASAQTH